MKLSPHSRCLGANDGGVIVKLLVILVIVIAAVAGLAFMFREAISEQVLALKTRVVSELQHRELFAETAWSPRTAGEVTLDAPFPITAGPSLLDELPPAARQLLVHADTFRSHKALRFFRVSVIRFEYVPGTDLSLDKAAEGRIREGAGAVGDKDPQFDLEPTLVDGLEARRATYHQESGETPISIDLVVVKKDTVLWLVNVIYVSRDAAEDAQRILQSVHIKPAQ